jgi:hypothetical protein
MDENTLEREAADLPRLRGQILALEQSMRQMPEHQIVITPRHFFADGLYAREVLIPKDSVATGKIHLFEHINIVSKGDVSVMTDDGIQRIQAPAILISRPGTKRVAWAHEDTVWTTIHACTERDVEKIEDALVVETYEQYALRLAERESKQLEENTPCHLLP